MIVLAIDPGSEASAWVLWDGERVIAHGKQPNKDVRDRLRLDYWGSAGIADDGSDLDDSHFEGPDACVIEQIASYGMTVGAEVFATCVWVGRFIEMSVADAELMPRKDVKLHLCGQPRAKDSNIRQAIIDRFGGKAKAIGRKASQGPLYGIKADEWSALALGVTWWDLNAAKSGAK